MCLPAAWFSFDEDQRRDPKEVAELNALDAEAVAVASLGARAYGGRLNHKVGPRSVNCRPRGTEGQAFECTRTLPRHHVVPTAPVVPVRAVHGCPPVPSTHRPKGSTMTTILITRTERDLILAELWRLCPSDQFDDPMPFGSHEEAEASIRQMQLAMAIRDELGWTDDDPRTSFEVPLACLPSQLLRDAASGYESDVARHVEYRETHILGLRPTRFGTSWADDHPTREDANIAVERGIASSDANRHALEHLIARIESQAVTA